MQIVIDIDENLYTRLFDNGTDFYDTDDILAMAKAIRKGTPLPKGHGRLIDKDHMIARLEAASKFYGGENADAFDERFSHGLKEAAIKVSGEPTIIEADKAGSEDIYTYLSDAFIKSMRKHRGNPNYVRKDENDDNKNH